MRNPWGISAALSIALAALPTAVLAQPAPPPFDKAIDVQTFEYAIGPKTFFSVSDADVAAKKQLAIDAFVTYLTKPFQVFNTDASGNKIVCVQNQPDCARVVVVDSVAAAQFTMAYGITDKIQVGAKLPVIFSLSGDGLDPSTGMASMTGLSVTGIGDLLLEGKMRLYKKGKVRAAAMAGVSIPTSVGSDGSQFIGDNLPTARIGFAVQLDPTPKVSFGANTGLLLRKPRTIYDSTIGPQFTWGLGAAGRITERFSIIAELNGRAGLPDFSLDASPLEVDGGLRVYVTSSVAVVLGGGAGLVKGIGSPTSRFFISFGYAPDVRDTDGDGIPNGRDKCPLVPEDFDGFEDADGCPDDDNDKDGKPDAVDKCPNEAEDIDGFEDDDGCPDLDNDKDGIPDLQDKCPNDPEDGKMPFPKDGCPANKRDSDGDGIMDDVDKCPTEEEDLDGFEDGDGCPDPDNDGDGIPDSKDKCPNCAEDKDGFQDADGCPDLDNDKDGIPDSKDKCPNEPETVNGFQDEDGCPDTGGVTVVKLDGDRLIVDRLPTLAGTKLSAAGTIIVDQMAMIMRGHDEVTKWLVAVGQPTVADANTLAAAVKARLVVKGVNEAALHVVGATGPAKIGGVVQERADANTPFVCPAQYQAKERPGTSAPAKTDKPAPKPATTPATPKKPDAPAPKKPDAPTKKPDEIEIE